MDKAAYKKDLLTKKNELVNFLKENSLPSHVENIIGSPLIERYRTTSSRKLRKRKGEFYPVMGDGESVGYSYLMEAEFHEKIYEFMLRELNRKNNYTLAKRINFLVIRGTYDSFCVICNIYEMDATIVRSAKDIGKKLKDTFPEVISFYLYLDPTKSSYYLEAERPAGILNTKKIFGSDVIFFRIQDCLYRFSPFSFSQVNLSILPDFLSAAESLLFSKSESSNSSGELKLEKNINLNKTNNQAVINDKPARLIDLYCGYGLFSTYLKKHYDSITGIEISQEAIYSARKNCPSDQTCKTEFLQKDIYAESLLKHLPAPPGGEHVILDPPASGTKEGVIEVIADRNPSKVLHIFCRREPMPDALRTWKRCGYFVKKILPADMFPGTPQLETMILLEKK